MTHKRPLIGITSNHTPKDAVGDLTGLGPFGQDWHLLPTDYIRAIEKAGGCPVIIPIVNDLETIAPLLEQLDGILFSGGSDIDPAFYGELPQEGLGNVNPVRDMYEIPLCKLILNDYDIPVLGICRGNQLINVSSGGTLYQDIKSSGIAAFRHNLLNYPKWYATRKLYIEKDSRLHKIFNSDQIYTNGFNHQAIKTLGKNLRITMRTEDQLAEGIESTTERLVIGIQWHPDVMLDHSDEFLCLFVAFELGCKRSAPL